MSCVAIVVLLETFTFLETRKYQQICTNVPTHMCVRNCYLPSKQTHISHLLQGSLLRLTLILDYGNQQGGEEGVGGEQMWNSEVWRHSHFSLQHRNCEKKINQNFTNLGLRAICWKQSKMLKSYSFLRKKHHADFFLISSNFLVRSENDFCWS